MTVACRGDAGTNGAWFNAEQRRAKENAALRRRFVSFAASQLMRGDGLRLRRWGFHRRDLVLHRLLHLLEGAHLDLAHALAGHAELLGQLLERDRIVGQPTRLEDAALAV